MVSWPLDAGYPSVVIIARGVAVEAGIRRLLSDASFSLQAGDKVGLVGANGAGKTTLLRTLAGEREPADGHIARSGTIGYLSQEAALRALEDERVTALERILMARDIGLLERRMEDVRLQMETEVGDERDRLIRRFSRIEDEFTARGGYVAKAEAKRFGFSLGIGNDELEQLVVTMSGGQRRRVELARILFAETDSLLLDEPTNHLDLDAKAWLMSFLADYKGGLMVISHDLPLLDKSISSVIALDNGIAEHFRGNYSFYITERDLRREQRIRERKHQDEKIARLEEGIRRFKGSTEKMAKRAAHGRPASTSSSPSAPRWERRPVECRWNFRNRRRRVAHRSKPAVSPRRLATTWSSSTSTSISTAGSE